EPEKNADSDRDKSLQIPSESVNLPENKDIPVDGAKSPDNRDGSYEDGIIKGLQEAVLARMEKNGPITDQMRRDVENNVYHDSLINWIKSF
ncbi:MAG: alpha-amylase, partial [Lachnospiraceae bacterium]|nr:alpha-amylase [Lachnospiraceae bacterium]